MKKIPLLISAIALPFLSACIGPAAFETEPVRVPTAKGYVFCQLYMHNSVTWDHAISHPETMSVNDADDICLDMGYELARASKIR